MQHLGRIRIGRVNPQQDFKSRRASGRNRHEELF
jgi:hypothetical protein